MQAFSRTLIDLYHVAENTSLQRFPEEVLRLLQPWIDFDGAVFGMGAWPAPCRWIAKPCMQARSTGKSRPSPISISRVT